MRQFHTNHWMLRLAVAFLLALASYSLANAVDNMADCTLYYTPRESGFVVGRGFNLQLQTRPGLEGRHFAVDFLKAVQVEGHGRLAKPYHGFSYIYYNGKWGYTDYPRGIQQRPLVPLQSCATSIRSDTFKMGMWIRTEHKALPMIFRNRWWKVSDVGSGVKSRQIDLYWGEDAPKGPGMGLYQPAGISFNGVRNAKFNLSSVTPQTKKSS